MKRMNEARRTLGLILLYCFIAGCGPKLPSSTYPAEMEKAFNSTFETMWTRCVDAVDSMGGTIITKDKPGGVLACRFPSSRKGNDIYANICVRRSLDSENVTSVCVVPFRSIDYTAMEFPAYKVTLEFQDIRFRRDFTEDVGRRFFLLLYQRT
jgi:hypothetical protein